MGEASSTEHIEPYFMKAPQTSVQTPKYAILPNRPWAAGRRTRNTFSTRGEGGGLRVWVLVGAGFGGGVPV